MEIPESDLKKMTDQGCELTCRADVLGKIASLQVSFLGALRASSAKFKGAKAVDVDENNWLTLEVTFAKGKDILHEIRRIPPGADENHPRSKMIATIKRALTAGVYFVPAGPIKAASTKITKMMKVGRAQSQAMDSILRGKSTTDAERISK